MFESSFTKQRWSWLHKTTHKSIWGAVLTFVSCFVYSAINARVYFLHDIYCISWQDFYVSNSPDQLNYMSWSGAKVRESNKAEDFGLTKLPKSLGGKRWTLKNSQPLVGFLLMVLYDFNDGKRSWNQPNLTVWELNLSFTSVNTLMAGAEDCISLQKSGH